MDRRLRELILLVIFAGMFVGAYTWQAKLNQEVTNEMQRELEYYRSILQPLYLRMDSLQLKRDENDTTHYYYTADSLEGYFAKRYGQDIDLPSQSD